MTNLFRKAKQNRIFQDIVEQIQDVILEGKLKPGEKLPSERELGEMLGTSRGTLREALRILEQKGLIEIRLGVNGGAIVKEATFEQMSETLGLLIRSQSVSLEHLAEFREHVESVVAGMAARRCDAKAKRELKTLLQEAEKHYQKGLKHWDRFVEVDEKIHAALARISGNPIYTFIIATIHDNIDRYYDRFLEVGKAELEENFTDLKELIEAVIAQDSEQAETIARDHVRRFDQHMAKKVRKA